MVYLTKAFHLESDLTTTEDHLGLNWITCSCHYFSDSESIFGRSFTCVAFTSFPPKRTASYQIDIYIAVSGSGIRILRDSASWCDL